MSTRSTESALKPLWACWAALAKARDDREPLDLDLPERRVVLDEKGRILSVAARERLDAHRLVEDYMIAANVAAAKALEAKKAPVMYRDHEPPSREKLVALKDYLATFDMEFALGQVVQPATFNRILKKIDDETIKPQVMEMVPAQPDAGLLFAPSIPAISACRSAAMPISPGPDSPLFGLAGSSLARRRLRPRMRPAEADRCGPDR